jgi:ubiquinone/menaquinone biosynthesis C-methylase UbiE
VTDDAGLVFDRIAEEYDRVRTDYPDALVDEACRIAGLEPSSPVVEVGCGTGKLTRSLVERGLRVDAVDPGREMIAVARRHVGEGVRFHVGRFEDVDLAEDAFAAVFSATAFHWIDPAVGWSKAARLLRPGGVLALLTHVGGRGERDQEMHAAWREALPDSTWKLRDPEVVFAEADRRRGNVSEVWAWLSQHDLANAEAAAVFGDVRIARLRIEDRDTAEEVLALIRTTSSYLRLDAETRERLDGRLRAIVDDAGGSIRSTRFATLVTARAQPLS